MPALDAGGHEQTSCCYRGWLQSTHHAGLDACPPAVKERPAGLQAVLEQQSCCCWPGAGQSGRAGRQAGAAQPQSAYSWQPSEPSAGRSCLLASPICPACSLKDCTNVHLLLCPLQELGQVTATAAVLLTEVTAVESGNVMQACQSKLVLVVSSSFAANKAALFPEPCPVKLFRGCIQYTLLALGSFRACFKQVRQVQTWQLVI